MFYSPKTENFSEIITFREVVTAIDGLMMQHLAKMKTSHIF